METLYGSVDLGGTNTACAVGTAEGRLIAQRVIPTGSQDGPSSVLDRIGAAMEELARAAGAPLAAVGMGMPGLVDRARGVTLFLPNLATQWRNIAAADCLGRRAGCPVYLLNDVRTATLGELAFGNGRGVGTMVFFALGTGIGGGVVVDGALRLGPLGAAGELGHQTILPDGPLCGCGNRGCLEALASGPAIAGEGFRLMQIGLAPRLYQLTAGDAGRVTPKLMADAAAAGDEAVRGAIIRAAQYLGVGVANMITALHPELVVLGGGVAATGALLFDTVKAVVRERVRMFPPDDVRIEPSALGPDAGLYGGLALAIRGGGVS